MNEASKQRMEKVSCYMKQPFRDIYEGAYQDGMQDPDAVGLLEENKRLRGAIDFAIGHLSSMENYSIVSGAIHALKESKGGE